MSKDNKSFHEKLKQFFRINKGAGPSRSKSDEYVILSDEVISDLKPENPLSTRVKVIKEITEVCKTRRAESHTTEKIWILISDMFRPEIPKDIRHLVFSLFTTLCQCQLEKSGFLRAKFFTFIKSHELLEDAGPRFQFLKALTENGRDVSYFDEKIGPLILSWMAAPQVNSIRIGEFMSFLVNIIKFNQSFLDQDVLVGIIQNICFISCTCSDKDDVHECLNVLGAVICYGSLPPGSLATFVATLCRTVNVDPLCQTSWKIMRNLLGTHLGPSGLFTMCNFMETAERSDDVAVIRGAVFFVGVVLWGNKMIRSLKYSPNTVLTSFVHALERRHPLITFEVMMRVQDLVRSNGENLHAVSWDLILKITKCVINYSKTSTISPPVTVDLSYYPKITKCVNETLDAIERIVEVGSFMGSKETFFEVVDIGVAFRSEASVDKLLQHKVRTQILSSKPGWFNNLTVFADRHFKQEVRTGLKVKALSHIAKVCLDNRDMYEEDLIDKIILPHLKNLETETDHIVRQNGVKFLVDFLMNSTSKKGHDLLLILERIVNRPYETQAQAGDTIHIFTENEVRDVSAVVNGLVQLFQKKIYHLPSSIAVTTYKILVRHLSNHYKKPAVLESCTSLRYVIFECFFRLRANSLYHLGFPDKAKGVVVSYSSYLAVDHRDGEKECPTVDSTAHHLPTVNSGQAVGGTPNSISNASSSASHQQQIAAMASVPTVTYVSLTTACKLVVQSLKKEKDWKVLELILLQIPYVMENKALILSKHGNDIEFLATALCAMVSDKSLHLPESLRNWPPKSSRSEFHAYLFPILTALVSYHSHLESNVQLKIVKCLEFGLVSKCSRICILSLSICTLEMKDTMHKLLPEVLLSLSKISPKVNIAIPVLEFLSTLIHLPRVFASFVQDQYMSIFAIALPYTNPFKFNQYTVSLAHHVIAMWFLKCRLSFRRDFVSYIIKGLEANVWAPFEEETKRASLELRNEDSSNRKRSSSLTEQTQRRRERPISGHGPMHQPVMNPHPAIMRGPHLDMKPNMDQSQMTFHKELTETCVDLMARYAFADCSALPTKFPSASFLLSGGHSQAWMVDNRIITITTSGCTQKELRDGLCDKCWSICRKQRSYEENNSKSSSQDTPPHSGTSIGRTHSMKGLGNNSENPNSSQSNLAARRRHRSAFAGASSSSSQQKKFECSSPGTPADGKEYTKDDLHLEHKLQLSNPPTGSDLGSEDGHGMSSPFFSDIKIKSEPFLCTCWCQGWAEVHIRRPTGNTSWMMRVQNTLGNYAGTDMTVKELSAIYFQNIMETTQNESLASSPSSSALSSPTHQQASQSIKSSPMASQDSEAGPMSPKTPDSPTDPVEDNLIGVDILKKNPVRRSNSSPEMTSSWKNPLLKRQGEIEEQDEEDLGNSTEMVTPNYSQVPPTTPATPLTNDKSKSFFNENHASNEKEKEMPRDKPQSTSPPQLPTQSISKAPGTGTNSPFRRSYEAIPEEVLQKVPVKRGSIEITSPNIVDGLPPITRDRISTISVMTPARRNQGLRRMLSQGADPGPYGKYSSGETGIRSGVSPSFIFLELCSQGVFGNTAKPFLLSSNPANDKSLKVLDYIPPYETHKIGVLYVGPGQSKDEAAILQNQHGSLRYRDFLQGLGSLVKLQEIDGQKVYIGGLSKDGSDGNFACIWQDDVMQVMFHVATMMPNKQSDPSGNFKKCHIGNDYVAIVYNNSEEEYDIATIKGQFLYACVIIQPLDHKTNRVIVKAKPILSLADNIGHTEPKIVSDQNLPIMVRQLSLHCNLASEIFQRMQTKGCDPYASNWLERLRHIKRLRTRLHQDHQIPGSVDNVHHTNDSDPFSTNKCPFNFKVVDFTEFV